MGVQSNGSKRLKLQRKIATLGRNYAMVFAMGIKVGRWKMRRVIHTPRRVKFGGEVWAEDAVWHSIGGQIFAPSKVSRGKLSGDRVRRYSRQRGKFLRFFAAI
jgi:hypothetical protein